MVHIHIYEFDSNLTQNFLYIGKDDQEFIIQSQEIKHIVQMSKQVITIQCIPEAIICAISAYHYLSCEFEPRSWRDVLDTTLCDKVCQ